MFIIDIIFYILKYIHICFIGHERVKRVQLTDAPEVATR